MLRIKKASFKEKLANLADELGELHEPMNNPPEEKYDERIEDHKNESF